jgi:hypothetical protein
MVYTWWTHGVVLVFIRCIICELCFLPPISQVIRMFFTESENTFILPSIELVLIGEIRTGNSVEWGLDESWEKGQKKR